ncbi:hypothetical protein BGX24_001935 [Mortierella sp. AD032]|nr:hypothetical protein BGX24_001935 [Mortierella sp. AD032]
MSLFKRSNKNKSASAASTPAQTPRASMQTIRDSGTKMTPEEALYKISQNMMTNASTVHRFVGLDIYKDDVRIGEILEEAQAGRVRSLEIDIVDAGYFLHSKGCVNLEALRCGYHGTVSLAKRLAKQLAEVGTGTDELGLALGVPTVETEAELSRLPFPEDAFQNGMIRPYNTIGAIEMEQRQQQQSNPAICLSPFSRINLGTSFRIVTALIARNPRLRVLEFTNDEEYCVDGVPDLAPLFPRLVYLTKLQIQVTSGLQEEFVASILCFLPDSIQDIEIKASKLLPPLQSSRSRNYPTIFRELPLRRLSLNPCGHEEFTSVGQRVGESRLMDIITKPIRQSPQLVDLELLGEHYRGMDVLWILSRYCPEIERLSLRVASHDFSVVVPVYLPPLLRLREVHIDAYTDASPRIFSMAGKNYGRVLPDFLRRSYKTLEVLTVNAEYNDGMLNLEDGAFEAEAWNFWRECPRLKKYSFRVEHTSSELNIGVTTTPCHHTLPCLTDNVKDNSNSNESSSTWACLELEELVINIRHGSSIDCNQDPEDIHVRQFLSLVRPFYQRLRLLKRLKRLWLRWDFCGKCEYLEDDRLLEFVNVKSDKELDESLMTINDLAWMDLAF